MPTQPRQVLTMHDTFTAELDSKLNGAVSDIFRFDQAYQTIMAFNIYIDDLNTLGSSSFIHLLQQSLIQTMAMSLRRTLDAKGKRSILKILNFIESNPTHIKKIQYIFTNNLTSATSIHEASQLTSYLKDIRETHPSNLSSPLNSAYIRLRTLTDKRIAHNDCESLEQSPTLRDFNELAGYAKCTIDHLGKTFLSKYYILDNEYILTRDARRAAVGAQILLEKAFSPHT